MIKIHKATGFDLLECNRLQVIVFTGGEHRDVHEKGSHWWLAKVDGEPAGFACLKLYDDGTAYLALAGVLPKYRGLGIQKRLIKCREAYARNRGADMMITYVAWANWPSANSLIRNGYTLYSPGHAWGLKMSLYFRKALR